MIYDLFCLVLLLDLLTLVDLLCKSDGYFWLVAFAGIAGKIMVYMMDDDLWPPRRVVDIVKLGRAIVTIGLTLRGLHWWKVFIRQFTLPRVVGVLTGVATAIFGWIREIWYRILDWIRTLILDFATAIGTVLAGPACATGNAMLDAGPDALRCRVKGQLPEETDDGSMNLETFHRVGPPPRAAPRTSEVEGGFIKVDCSGEGSGSSS